MTNETAGRSIPDVVPDTAFLGAGDMPGQIKGVPERLADGEWPLPTFCGSGYEQSDKLGVRATLRFYFCSPGAPPESTPKSVVYQDVLVFRESGAGAFLDGLRAAVTGCASQLDENGSELRNHLRGSLSAGDDSVLVEQTRPATDETGDPRGDGSLQSTFWAVARIGDAIAFVSNTGWESCSAEQADTLTLGQRAAQRLAAWRVP
jgi:hypothetical protein